MEQSCGCFVTLCLLRLFFLPKNPQIFHLYLFRSVLHSVVMFFGLKDMFCLDYHQHVVELYGRDIRSSWRLFCFLLHTKYVSNLVSLWITKDLCSTRCNEKSTLKKLSALWKIIARLIKIKYDNSVLLELFILQFMK